MSATIGLLLEAHTVSLLAPGARRGDDTVISVPWSPDAPDNVVEALRAHLASGAGAPRGLVLVVGLYWMLARTPNSAVNCPENRHFLLNPHDPYADR